MKKENCIGKVLKGFDFSKSEYSNAWNDTMIHYVDVEGAITDVHHDDKWFNVRFKSGAHWSYPVDLSMKQIEKNEQAEVPVDLNELFNQIKSL